MSKLRAVSLHFMLSLAIVATVLAVVFTQWYPQPYFSINGAHNVLRTLIGVDLVLGPLLTLILYRPGKWGLKFDMTFIAVVQLSALVYGTSVMYQERPQYMVFAVDRFVVLPAGELFPAGVTDIAACSAAARAPCIAVAMLPGDPKEREEVLFRTLEKGVELEQQPAYWIAFDEGRDVVIARSRPLSELGAHSAELREAVDALVREHHREVDSLRFVPVVNKRLEAMTLVIDGSDASVVDVIGIDPWSLAGDADRADG